MLPSFSLSSQINKGRISSFLLQGPKTTHKSGASCSSSEISAGSSIKLLAVATIETVHPEWCQSDKPFLDPPPLGACTFCSSRKC